MFWKVADGVDPLLLLNESARAPPARAGRGRSLAIAADARHVALPRPGQKQGALHARA
jgi:hypothetical protein